MKEGIRTSARGLSATVVRTLSLPSLPKFLLLPLIFVSIYKHAPDFLLLFFRRFEVLPATVLHPYPRVTSNTRLRLIQVIGPVEPGKSLSNRKKILRGGGGSKNLNYFFDFSKNTFLISFYSTAVESIQVNLTGWIMTWGSYRKCQCCH